MKLLAAIALVAVTCVNAAAADAVDTDCVGESYGTFPETGDSWSIEAVSDDDPTTLTGEGSLFHELADGRRFVGDVERIRCRRNGGVIADIAGTGRFLATPGLGEAKGHCRGTGNPHGGETDCARYEFLVALRDDPPSKVYTFRLRDEGGEDVYAIAGLVIDGELIVTPSP